MSSIMSFHEWAASGTYALVRITLPQFNKSGNLNCLILSAVECIKYVLFYYDS